MHPVHIEKPHLQFPFDEDGHYRLIEHLHVTSGIGNHFGILVTKGIWQTKGRVE